MCGICGYINWDNRDALDRMLKRMVHRGPDEEGKVPDEPQLKLAPFGTVLNSMSSGDNSAFSKTACVSKRELVFWG